MRKAAITNPHQQSGRTLPEQSTQARGGAKPAGTQQVLSAKLAGDWDLWG